MFSVCYLISFQFLVIIYVLYLCWLVATCLAMVPLVFFHAADKGMCNSLLRGQDCIDLRQWGKET